MKGNKEKKHKYTLKPNRTQMKAIREAWASAMSHTDVYWHKIRQVEKELSAKTGIKDIEFINDTWMGDGLIGIGNVARTMRLLQRDKLEKK